MESPCERHNLPHTITIFGHEIQVNLVDGLGEEEEDKKDWGETVTSESPMRISINSSADARRAYQTLVHEVLEVIKSEMDLPIKHRLINQIELGLTDFLLNNDIDWGYANGIRD